MGCERFTLRITVILQHAQSGSHVERDILVEAVGIGLGDRHRVQRDGDSGWRGLASGVFGLVGEGIGAPGGRRQAKGAVRIQDQRSAGRRGDQLGCEDSAAIHIEIIGQHPFGWGDHKRHPGVAGISFP